MRNGLDTLKIDTMTTRAWMSLDNNLGTEYPAIQINHAGVNVLASRISDLAQSFACTQRSHWGTFDTYCELSCLLRIAAISPWLNASHLPTGLADSIAVACDDGCLRLFGIEEGELGLTYHSTLPHLDGRLLSVAWHPAGRIAVVGTSQGTLHAWDTSSKREILRIQTGETSKYFLTMGKVESGVNAV